MTFQTIAGRWVVCPQSTATVFGERVYGIEFNVNRRFQFFREDSSGSIEHTGQRGRVVVTTSSPNQVSLEFARRQPCTATLGSPPTP